MLDSLKNNRIEKLMAFGITLVLMVYVQSATNPYVRRAFSVPLEYMDKPFNGQVRDSDRLVTVYVSGEKARVDAVQPGEIKAFVSLKSAGVGQSSLPVQVRLADSLAGLLVEPAKSAELVTVGQQITKRLPVTVELIGAAPDGFSLKEPAQATPDFVRVSGWKDQVDKVASVRVRVDLSAVRGNVGSDFPVTAYNSDDKPISEAQVKVVPEEINVRLNLTPQPRSKTVIVDVPVEGQPAYPYHVAQIKVDRQQVELIGDPDKLASISVVQAEPISLNNITQTTVYKTRLKIPDGLRVKGSPTVEATVTVKKDREPGSP